MNTQKNNNNRLSVIGNRMVFRLWAIMMALVLFGIGFMWVVQIFLFEQNYADTALAEALNRMEPVMETLATEDIAKDDRMLPYLSHITNGELILINQEGTILQLFSYGHPVDTKMPNRDGAMWERIRSSEEFPSLQEGRPYRRMEKHGTRVFAFELGFPVTYNGQNCYLILHNTLMLQTTLNLNRRQLTFLTVVLTITASILAAVLSRQFTKPIYAIKDTVDRLAKNDFNTGPALTREDELGQLSHSVEELGQALQRVDVLRKEVIANVSHELRSPLALIAGYAEMVRDISWKDETQRNENLDLIIHEAHRMSEMVNDIMDYSQFQAGYIKLKKDSYNLYDVVESEVTQCTQSAANDGIRLELLSFSKDIPVQVDALKISQVMRNLLNNAINHTADGGTVYITIEQPGGGDANRTDRAGHACRVSVKNPGDPIPEEDRAIIWERYQRSQHSNGRRLGTGIGLSIVSTILEAHEMEYGVDWEDGYTVFWFTAVVE